MKPKKSLGQHFLRCNWVVSTLIKAAEVDSQDTVLEIGPGTGILTRALAKSAKKVIAIEKDEKLAESLRKEKIPNVVIVTGDILKLMKSDFISFGAGKFKVVANIPYYLTSRLLRLLLENEPSHLPTGRWEGKPRPHTIVLTIQKEVAERICARPPKMNLLALSVQAYGRPEIIKKVPASCFRPKPKVDSAIIKISDISNKFFTGVPPTTEVGLPEGSPTSQRRTNQALFFKIIRLAFSQKRKTLVNTLGTSFGRKAIEKALGTLNLPKTRRPEELLLTEWARLTFLISAEK